MPNKDKKLAAKQAGTYARLDKNGLIQIICELTGNVLAVQSSYDELEPAGFYETIDQDGNKIKLQHGVSQDSIPTRIKYPYSQIAADIICQKIAEGKTLIEICEEDGMPPYSMLCRWRRSNQEFRDGIENARKDRAESFHDKVIQEAQDADAANLSETKVRIDAYKWASGVGDPDKFGSKTKVVGDKDSPISFVIDTGIRRPEDYNKDEALASRDVTEEVPSGETSSETKDAITAVGDNDSGDSGEAGPTGNILPEGENRSAESEHGDNNPSND